VRDAREALARALHETYLRDREAAGERRGSTAALTTWDLLPEEFRESSRRSADGLREAFHERGYELADSTADGTGVALADEDFEAVAVRLHERWVDERTATGWRHGTPRDDVRRIHPDLVPWTELSDARREIDRGLVRSFPEALRAAGLALQFPGIDESVR
jgi:RyR domain